MTPDFIARAKLHQRRLNIPDRALSAYKVQASRALKTVGFEITLAEWWIWWQTDGRWANRGYYRDSFVMGRKSDMGPYRLDNIICITNSQNARDGSLGRIKHRGGRPLTLQEIIDKRG
jgi:hypothetical protein